MIDTLTNTELAVLGLVAERPRHGYLIEQAIEERGFREWTEIGFSSIYYVLNKLEASGWLVSDLNAEPLPPEQVPPEQAASAGRGRRRGPARRVYRLTEAGRQVLRDAVWQRLSQPRPRTGDFDLALANLPALNPETVREGLAAYRADLRSRLLGLRAKYAFDKAAAAQQHRPLPPHVDLLFSRSIYLLESEIAWVAAALAAYQDARSHETGSTKGENYE